MRQAEASLNPADAKDLRARLRSLAAAVSSAEAFEAMPSTVGDSGGSGGSVESARGAPRRRPPSLMLDRGQFVEFVSRLARTPGAELDTRDHTCRNDDAYIADRLFDAIDTEDVGRVRTETAVRAVFPAFAKEAGVRRRWVWAMVYDPRGRGELCTNQIFRKI